MRIIAILSAALFIFASCGNDKKNNEKLTEETKVEETIKKIDSVAYEVNKSTEDLKETVKEVKDVINELDNI